MSNRLEHAFHLILLIPAALMLMGAASLEPDMPGWASGAAVPPCEIVGEPALGTIQGGGEISRTFDLESGTYSAVGWASWDIVSLGLEVADSTGTTLMEDAGACNNPVCEFTLVNADRVTVTVTAGEARIPGVPADYAFVLAEGSGCFQREISPVKEALDDWTAIIAADDATVVHWEIMELTGEDMLVIERAFHPGSHAVIAETTDPRDDIDMYVRLGEDTILSMD